MGVNTITMPVISTGHVDETTADLFTRLGAKNDWCHCLGWQYGWVLYLDDVDEEAPQCLRDIADWLQKHGFHDRWVRLDRDADKADDLPFYEW